jgi:hypothetical protein
MKTSIEKLPWVIFDMDGTLANIDHRIHLIKKKPKNWDKSHDMMVDDILEEKVKFLADACFDSGMNIAIVTGRPEKCRIVTSEWLYNHGIMYDELHMRPDDDFTPDWEIKEKILIDNFLECNRNIYFVVDDRDCVVAMWRQHGLTCFQCKKGDY